MFEADLYEKVGVKPVKPKEEIVDLEAERAGFSLQAEVMDDETEASKLTETKAPTKRRRKRT